MTQVNSPSFLRKIVPRSEFSKNQLNLIDNLLRIIEQLYNRSGGETDEVGLGLDESISNENQIALNLALIAQLQQQVENIENDIQPQVDLTPQWNDISQSQDYTMTDWDDVSATGRITLKLPANPVPTARYAVGNDDGVMKTIDGNGIKIRRKRLLSTIRTKAKGTRMIFRYKVNANEYVLV